MQKRPRQSPHHPKSKSLPQTHRPLVRAHHKIKLHRAKSPLLRPLQRMRAHRASHPAPLPRARRHISAIRHMRPSTMLIRPQKISPRQHPTLLRHKHLMPLRKPKRQRRLRPHPALQRISLPRTNHRLQHQPNPLPIPLRSRSYHRHLRTSASSAPLQYLFLSSL
jgi:hypothetical protein